MFHLFVIDHYEGTPADYFKGSYATLEEAFKETRGEEAELFQSDETGSMKLYAEMSSDDEYLEGTTRVKRVRGWKLTDGTFKLMDTFIQHWVPTPIPTDKTGIAVTGVYSPGYWEREG